MTELSYLFRAETVRERSENLFAAGLEEKLDHFSIRLDRLPEAARLVARVTRETYPDRQIPVHGRFRHFAAGGVDRLSLLEEALSGASEEERARARFDLVVTSVLLDAGAGPRWSYHERDTGLSFARSEGLAVASFRMFLDGLFSDGAREPFRATALRLGRLTVSDLERGFQAGRDNPLVGLEGRTALLRSLGSATEERPEIFGSPARVGNLVDFVTAGWSETEVEATALLEAVLRGLSSIWPHRPTIEGVKLGDVWRHKRAGGYGSTAGFVPFHKLSQWLTYSLVEPLALSGIRVRGLDALTGLAEYRNGGLFVDAGVLVPRHRGITEEPHPPGSEVVVEWRALTVALLDRIAELVRDELGMDRKQLPLGKVLEGGTWRAGRRLASERRPDGSPPIRVESDGTVF